jgi:hypothetical protein
MLLYHKLVICKYKGDNLMKFSENNVPSGTMSKESLYEEGVEEGKFDDTHTDKSWENVKESELEMISKMDTYLGKSSQHLSKKAKVIMQEWKTEE